ncbi:amino acid ABC transporter permease [Nocardioides marmotae]|uniref:ABC transporter permease subunit n=1 Tax=Nocardioides marmotae TaxID=2663857 RepID=A0A6I3J4K2_9ACTN|nr:amino acid ABC transporter permease [Nocardioides marmotae]MCR6030302.1 ABC transporter permease subunit [Gordonia jinghuaiqii]MBC9734407.1 amino acid ABC transporter permease [Nocardioides marmotae]MTB85507.1 ABC transporter permease subunit [Nocardioides marmotae]MTB93934.1 ABC transporter permease subunit [Nocardioides marmotae]QKE00250.1 amino acid ABC transporter permease [Nocardioides marmotae]
MNVVLDNLDLVGWAFAHTVLLFVFSGVLSMLLGTVLVAMRVGPVAVLRRAAAVYVALVRNTPLLIVLMFFQFAAPKIGITFNFIRVEWGEISMTSFFAAAVVSLTLYTSAFVCEALRSGVNAVPLGQAEAARSIGLPFADVMREVVLPQALRASVPPLASVQIALLKNTTVAGVFGVAEAFNQMRAFTNNFSSERFGIFVAFALIFVVLVEIVSFFASRLERRWRIA